MAWPEKPARHAADFSMSCWCCRKLFVDCHIIWYDIERVWVAFDLTMPCVSMSMATGSGFCSASGRGVGSTRFDLVVCGSWEKKHINMPVIPLKQEVNYEDIRESHSDRVRWAKILNVPVGAHTDSLFFNLWVWNICFFFVKLSEWRNCQWPFFTIEMTTVCETNGLRMIRLSEVMVNTLLTSIDAVLDVRSYMWNILTYVNSGSREITLIIGNALEKMLELGMSTNY